MNRLFESAQWIWHRAEFMDLVNAFIQARMSFRLPRRPRSAVVAVTADSAYRLFVNGRRVGQGPARGFQKAWPFDRVDIAPFLRAGDNAIAVLAYCLGIHNAKYLHTGWAGFILEGECGGVRVSTGPSWKVRRSPGHLRTLTRISCQTDFQEHFDARRDDGRWQQSGYDDSAWEAPALFPPYVPPWPDFSERGLPPLEETVRPARALVAVAHGRAAALEEDVSLAHALSEPTWSACRRALRQHGPFGEVSLPAPARGEAASYCLDFGRSVTGYPVLEVRGARGGEPLDILLCQVRDRAGVPRLTDPRRHPAGTSAGHRLILSRGVTRHETYVYSGFRYLVLSVRAGAPRLRVRAAVRQVAYPQDPRAAFRTSDARLNRIYRACRQSLECCLQDALVDCPTREQAQWWGLRAAANTALYLLDDPRVIARGLRQIGMQRADNGLVYSTAPSFLHNWILPECAWGWIVNLDDYTQWTGDRSVFRDSAESVRRVLEFTAGEADCHEGLVPTSFRGYQHRLYLSDPARFRSGAALYCLTHNLKALRAFRAAAALWRTCGDAGSARWARARAGALEAAAMRRFRVPAFPWFCDALSPRFEPIPPPMPSYVVFMVTQVLLTGLAGGRQADLAAFLWDLLQRIGRDPAFKPTPGHLYECFHALLRAGYRGELVRYIRRVWSIWTEERGLTVIPEHWWFDPRAMLAGAAPHAWASYPIELFTLLLLGLRRDAMGWRRVRFEPDVTVVDAASGCLPTPLGHIRVAWKRDGRRVRGCLEVPRGMTATLALAGRAWRRAGPCSARFDVTAPLLPRSGKE